MDIKDIREIINQFDNTNISYFQYETNILKLIMKKSSIDLSSSNQFCFNDEIACSSYNGNYYKSKQISEICSKYVGIVIIRDRKNDKCFVSVGKKIKKGDLLCIIEHLNLDIEVLSHTSGVLNEICICNNQFVEYGQVMFRISN